MNDKFDSTDTGLVKRIADNPGISMLEAGRPYLAVLTEGAIRYRLRHLSYKGYVRLERVNKNTTKCFSGTKTLENMAVIDGQAASLAN